MDNVYDWKGKWTLDGVPQETGFHSKRAATKWLSVEGDPKFDGSFVAKGCADVRIEGPGGETLRFEDLSRLG